MSTSNASTFIALPDDPDPILPVQVLTALIRAAQRPNLNKGARKFARPYAERAKELLTEGEN